MKKYVIKIFIVLFMIPLMFCMGCSSTNNNSNNNQNSTPSTNNNTNTGNLVDDVEIIALTLDNYQEYLSLQEEILIYNETPYTHQHGFSMIRANQTTKLSVIVIHSQVEFENVQLKIINNTWDGSYNVPGYTKHYKWNGSGGTLRISYNGEGSISLNATYDGYNDYSFVPMSYAIEEISGSVKIKSNS